MCYLYSGTNQDWWKEDLDSAYIWIQIYVLLIAPHQRTKGHDDISFQKESMISNVGLINPVVSGWCLVCGCAVGGIIHHLKQVKLLQNAEELAKLGRGAAEEGSSRHRTIAHSPSSSIVQPLTLLFLLVASFTYLVLEYTPICLLAISLVRIQKARDWVAYSPPSPQLLEEAGTF